MKLQNYLTEATSKITIAVGTDWHGVYIKGKLEHQGYLGDVDKFVKVLENNGIIEKGIVEFKEVNSRWLGSNNHLPKDIKDVEWEVSSEKYRKERLV